MPERRATRDTVVPFDRDIGRIRADHALKAVRALEATPKKAYGHYVSYVKGLGPGIVANGLGQALTMERGAMAKDVGHAHVYRQLEEWIMNGWPQRPAGLSGDTVLEALCACSQRDYVRAQQEAIAYIEWLKKFAAAFLDEDDRP